MEIKGSIIIPDKLREHVSYIGRITVVKVGHVTNNDRVIIPYIDFYPVLTVHDKDKIITSNRFYFNDFEDIKDNTIRTADIDDNIILSKGDVLQLTVSADDCFINFELENLNTNLEDKNTFIYLLPLECPFCNSEIVWCEKNIHKKSDKTLYVPSCENLSCPVFLPSNVQIFLDNIGFNQGYYRFIINKLIYRKLITNPIDIFFIKKQDIVDIDEHKNIDINKFLFHIEEVFNNLNLYKIIKGLFYNLIDEQHINMIADHCKTFSNLITKLEKIHDAPFIINNNNAFTIIVERLVSKFFDVETMELKKEFNLFLEF